jgi:hypothetical protein
MRELIECFLEWLSVNRSDVKAWTILEALARETLKKVDSHDPGLREFDAEALAHASEPTAAWDYDNAKRRLTNAKLDSFLEARRASIESFFIEHGHQKALKLGYRASAGRHRSVWFLVPYELPPPGEMGSLASPASAASFQAELVYEVTAPGQVKPNATLGRLLLGEGGEISTRSVRGVLWMALMIGSLVLVGACVYLFSAMSHVQRPLATSDLVLLVMIASAAWMFWRFGVRPWIWLLEDRIVPAGDWLIALSERPSQLELTKEKRFRLVRFGGTCPICAGEIELRYGQAAQRRRLFGCCSEAPQDHVFTFDRVLRRGTRCA